MGGFEKGAGPLNKLVFHRLVQKDLNAILRYYEDEGGRALADRFFSGLEEVLSSLARNPAGFHSVGQGLRRAGMKNFPYHILYRIRPSGTRILVLRHHKRHPEYGINRRLN
jgi:plasmid stabilization system protein ParE